jgi:hypothetical protein
MTDLSYRKKSANRYIKTTILMYLSIVTPNTTTHTIAINAFRWIYYHSYGFVL